MSDNTRTYFIRMNLDECNALQMSLWNDTDRLHGFQGMLLGCNGGPSPANAPDAFLRGWEIGYGWRQEAEQFRATRSHGGKASAEARKEKLGTAQPPRTPPEHVFDGCSTDAEHPPEPNQQPSASNQKTETSSHSPLGPNGAAGDAAAGGKVKKPRRGKYESEDIAPENAKFLQDVYQEVPKEHPVTGEEVHKGPYATAARAFQTIVNSGEATARELRVAGRLYYMAEHAVDPKGEPVTKRVYSAWDTRSKAIMQVATFYGPEKRAYRQILPLAREIIAVHDAREAAKATQAENQERAAS